MLQAIIDIGSNTIRMAIYNIMVQDGKDHVEMLYKDKQMVGLAGYLENGAMGQSGIDTVCGVLDKFKSFLGKLGIENVLAFTTAALRNCSNSKQAVSEIISRSGIDIKVVSGEEEAELDFVGATHYMKSATGLLVDIGGGSTELVYYADGSIVNKVSLPIGSLGYRKEYVSGLFPTRAEIGKMKDETKKMLSEHASDFLDLKIEEICGIGGTLKGTWGLYQQILGSGEEAGRMESAALRKIQDRFSEKKLTEDDVLILLRAIPERLETVLPGMVIAEVLAETFGSEYITYSDTGMREGFIYKEIVPNLA